MDLLFIYGTSVEQAFQLQNFSWNFCSRIYDSFAPSGYLDTAIDDLSMIVFFLLSVSVDKDDDNLITALFYFKLVVAIMVSLAYNGHIIHDVSGIRPHTEIVRHSYGMALCIQTHLECFSLL